MSLKAAAARQISPKQSNETAITRGEAKKELTELTVTQSALSEAWKKFSKRHEGVQVVLSQIMNQHLPQLTVDGLEYIITVVSAFQEKKLQEHALDIATYLREELSNSKIQMKVVVDETKEEKTFFTASDKLKLMIEKNPDLNLLRKSFDLDLE